MDAESLPLPSSCWTSRAPEATRAAAVALAGAIGDAASREAFVVALCGALGAGKTLFAQGLAEGLGIDPRQVASPTFAIVCEYPLGGGKILAHVDLYRLESAAELEATGFSDLLEPGNVLAVEWADRFPSVLPLDRLEVVLERPGLASAANVGDASAPAAFRRLSVSASGPVSRAVLERWERKLEESSSLQRG